VTVAKNSKSKGGVPENTPENKAPAEGSRENAGGISNRPLREEQERQDNLPPRGESKDGSHA
jgi:hypothetical protein